MATQVKPTWQGRPEVSGLLSHTIPGALTHHFDPEGSNHAERRQTRNLPDKKEKGLQLVSRNP
jgi:hypothetical protein